MISKIDFGFILQAVVGMAVYYCMFFDYNCNHMYNSFLNGGEMEYALIGFVASCLITVVIICLSEWRRQKRFLAFMEHEKKKDEQAQKDLYAFLKHECKVKDN